MLAGTWVKLSKRCDDEDQVTTDRDRDPAADRQAGRQASRQAGNQAGRQQ